MRTALVVLTLLVVSQPGNTALAEKIPVFVSPYYDSKGPTIDVGKFSEALRTAKPDTILDVTAAMRKEWKTLPIEAMYVAAIRLYDLGKKDEAAYWFYAAQWRSHLYRQVLVQDMIGGLGSDAFERLQADSAFQELAGQYINGYAFGDLPKLLNTMKNVQNDNTKLPDLATIYPQSTFIETTLWPIHNRQVLAEFEHLRGQIERNAEMIKSLRKKNGLDGKF